MAPRPPPRFVVRAHDAPRSGQWRLWLALAWLASLVLTAWIAGRVAWHTAPTAGGERVLATSSGETQQLRQIIANLQRAQQVGNIATRSLRSTLAEREEEISGLRADLGFYSRLVGGDAQRQGLKVQEAKLQPVAGSHGWSLALSLTQNVKRGSHIVGKVTLSVDGMRGDKVVALDWSALGDTAQKDGVPFRFKYFQQLHLTFVLPADFHPIRLHVRVKAEGAEPLERTVAWADALAGNLKPAPAS